MISKVRFVKGLANSILTYVPNMIHICPNMIHICPNKIYCSKSKKNIEIERLLEHDFCVFAL